MIRFRVTPHSFPPARRGAAAWLLLAAVGLVLLLPHPAWALEVYGLLTRSCSLETGLIVHTDGQSVFLLTPAGSLRPVAREAVSHVLVYNTVDNPIPVLELRGTLLELARDVRLGGDADSGFTGWPIRFEEEAIIFFDTHGRTHIENLERITAIRTAAGRQGADALPERQTLPESKPQDFRLGPNVADCPEPPATGLPAVYPTRVIADQININRFLSAFNDGFRELERFRERTVFYARPFLYDRNTKLGLQLGDFQAFPLVELSNNFPIYFQWSTGRNYASQGLIALGNKPVEWLPNVEPVFSARSDVKSGFFSASFVGNPLAFAAGQGFIIDNRFSYQPYFAKLDDSDLAVIPQFNHIALTGLDWGAYTFSAGYYYPLTGIYGGGRFREVLASSPSTLWRLMLTRPKWQARLLYAATQLGSNSPESEDLALIQSSEMRDTSIVSAESAALLGQVDRFSLDSRFLRFGWDWDLPRELQVGVDQVRYEGIYREYFFDGDYFRINYLHNVTSLHVAQSFGTFVALRLTVNGFDRHYEGHSPAGRDDQDYQNLSLTVAVEFVL